MSRRNPGGVVDFTRPVPWVNLGKELGSRVNEFMQQNAYTDASAVIRELVNIALSIDATHAINQNARKKAYDDARAYVMNRMHEALNQIGKEFYAELHALRPEEFPNGD